MLVTYCQQGESARCSIPEAMGRQCCWGSWGQRKKAWGVKNGDDEIYELELDWWNPKVHVIPYTCSRFPLSVLGLFRIPMNCQMWDSLSI